ncbi:unnamed protein product [Aureobasidium uvarum]|uniref:MutL C-terminal dimerisation domain-containing protein n=1 Tax=Aureobasidium uvarum TaxID=2773716 RepID=A0A9N8KF88_9PEZI|nr:unnamed protein product [Aureobasidium uvarum]
MDYTSGQEIHKASSAILPLPEDVVAQIKSSTTITNLNQVVLGLFENSLDAQATKVDVFVDFRRGGCTVEDNGIGILPSEFRETGGLGRVYHTSKQKDNTQRGIHGGQGTFLASIGALSLLTITSRHAQHYSHNTLSLHRSKAISRMTPTPPQNEIRTTTGHGTRVSVRDLFGNMPVRVKQRAIADEGGLETERQWQALKIGLVGLLLPWNRRVAVKVTDLNNPEKTIVINTGSHYTPNALSERNLNLLNKKMPDFDQSSVLSILSQSGIISTDSKSSWIPVSASTSSVTIKGLISMEPAPSKIAQFMSIGSIPCLDENRHNGLYEAVSRLFAQSNFGHVYDESGFDEAEMERRQHDRRYKKDGPTNRQLLGGRKGVDRWPRFYFRIDLKIDESKQHVSNLSDIHLKNIINVLESLTTHWLEANNFRPKRIGQKRKQVVDEVERSSQTACDVLAPDTNSRSSSAPLQFAPGSRTRPSNQADNTSTNSRSSKRVRPLPSTDMAAPTMPFTDWSRIKSAQPQMYDRIWNCKIPQARQSTASESTVQETSYMPEPPATIEVEAIDANQFGLAHDSSREVTAPQELDHIQCGETYIDWIDLKTNQRHHINARTGIMMPEKVHRPVSNTAYPVRSTAAVDSRLSSFGKPLVLERRKTFTPPTVEAISTAESSSSWLQRFLQTWKNPIFESQPEQAIPTASCCGPEQQALHTHDLHGQRAIADSFSRAGTTDTSRLSKSALPYAHVISQVDDKFILMKLPDLAGSKSQELDRSRQLLVLMDQHAASERCILEVLLRELCIPAQGTSVIKSKLGCISSIITNPVNKPLHFQIPLEEEALFRAHAGNFAHWGILYDIILHTPEPPRLNILTLPPGISERCKADPRILIELLRGEIYTLAESSSKNITHLDLADTDTNHAWLRRLGSCPKGLLQLLNSRACRSAIMFNDKMTLEQCQRLVEELAGCAFPFMCAHGRNSMVPLVYVGGEDGYTQESLGGFGGEEERSGGFASAYKRWRKKAE